MNWLRVLGNAEPSSIDEDVGHHLHPVVPLLDALKTPYQPLACILPRQSPLHSCSSRLDRFLEQALSPSLRGLALAWVFCDVRTHPCIEHALPMACGINAALAVELGFLQVQSNLFGHLLQGL
jgi:hypothetical protein